MSRQDRQGVRTAADLERKYDLGGKNSRGSYERQEVALNNLVQAVNQFIATTNAKLEELEENKAVSPDISIEEIEGGHRVTITDADGTESFDIMDGTSGSASPIARIGEVSLLASSWEGEGNLYHQIVEIEGVTENSQVDLTPDIEQLATFYEKDLAFVTENDNGTVTVYVIGQKPLNDYTIQVTITEVGV